MFTEIQQKNIDRVKQLIQEADYVIVGAGAGLSASAGIDYLGEEFFAKHYAPFLKKGYKTIWDGITDNWELTRFNKETFWGFWANHINNVYYKPNQLQPYKDLFNIVKDKDYFIITTNGDGQFYKGGFDKDRIFAMQGSYGYLQCQKPCRDEVYDNKEMVEQMLKNFDEKTLKIKKSDVPKCPRCGRLLKTNLRIDDTFVEKPHLVNMDKYNDFIEKAKSKKLLLLELGVGFNTPGVIRFPFQRMTRNFPNTTFVRINKKYCDVGEDIRDKSISFDIDIGEILSALSIQ